MNIHNLSAFAGMAGPVVLVFTDFTAAFTNPNYSYIQNSISSLALTRLGWLQTIGFLAIGLLVEIFVAGLLFNIKRHRGFHLSIGLLERVLVANMVIWVEVAAVKLMRLSFNRNETPQ